MNIKNVSMSICIEDRMIFFDSWLGKSLDNSVEYNNPLCDIPLSSNKSSKYISLQEKIVVI